MQPSATFAEYRIIVLVSLKWILLGVLVGLFAGVASAVFLVGLEWATATRLANPTLLVLLPLAGFAVGWVYHRLGGAAGRGSNLVIEEARATRARIPLRMTPLVLVGSVVGHLFGASIGREGSAVQMGASLADTLRRVLRLRHRDRRLMIMAGISGGFGAVFGTPIAAFLFGMEVQSAGRIRYDGLVPCFAAAFAGDWIVRRLGIHDAHISHLPDLSVDPILGVKISLAAIAFGVMALAFIEFTHAVKHLAKRIAYPPLRPFLGGVVILALTGILGTNDYLGLGSPLIAAALNGTGVPTLAFFWKMIFTGICLGMGFVGGEVTPLFFMGATLGSVLGKPLGIEPTLLAAVGFVAVFAAASNTPLATAIMGVELFGGGAILYLFLGTLISYLTVGHRGIYGSQMVAVTKAYGVPIRSESTLEEVQHKRQEQANGSVFARLLSVGLFSLRRPRTPDEQPEDDQANDGNGG
ncbi:MAG: chloride channel protein [Anaerolineales bacterium]|nr:chloride channel protein [Anaerolineales bacterium]